MGIAMTFRWFRSSSLFVPKAPTTTGITAALTFHNFYTLKVFDYCFSSFSFMFSSPGTAQLCFCIVSITIMPDLRCSISLSFWTGKSQSNLHFLLSCTGSG